MQEAQNAPAVVFSSAPLTANRTYKARIFEMIFSDKKELFGLYNAIYMSMHNDISFIIDSYLTLYEHQSTYSPNFPLRCLMYVSDLYSGITKETNLYGSKPVSLPTPKFVIFYNGTEEIPAVQTLKLSDAFIIAEDEYSLKLKATMLNINPGHNTALLNACKTLKDYSEYSNRVRLYSKTMSLKSAVEGRRTC